MKSLIKLYVLIFTVFVLNHATIAGSVEAPETAYLQCTSFGVDAEAVQMIRQDGETLEQLIVNLATQMDDELEGGARANIIFLTEVRRVGEWVYAYYPVEWEPTMVGTTYTQSCIDHTMAQLKKRYPDIANNLNDQARRAWESNH